MDFQTDLHDLNAQTVIEATQFCGYDIKQTNENQQMALHPNSNVHLSDNTLTASLQPLSWNMFRLHVTH